MKSSPLKHPRRSPPQCAMLCSGHFRQGSWRFRYRRLARQGDAHLPLWPLSSPTSERMLATVLFTDIVGSTEQLSSQGDSRWRHQLDVHDQLVDRSLSKYGGRRAKNTGDGLFALFEGPTKAARCGLELVPALATRGIRIRVGIHTGECERRGEQWSGMAVHTGARIGGMAEPDEVLTSRTVRDLSAGSGLRFESLGAHRLKGLAEETEVSASVQQRAA